MTMTRVQVLRKIKDSVLAACRSILCVTFILSGFAKLIDPMGTFYKLSEYLLSLGFGNFLPPSIVIIFCAVSLAVFEFASGMFLLFRVDRRGVMILLSLFMLAMTPLTFYLALYNPIADCGCFGDIIHLSNWQTFTKNVILLICALSCTIWGRQGLKSNNTSGYWMIRLYTIVFAIILAIVSLRTLPAIDVMPYRIGSHILEDEGTYTFSVVDTSIGDDRTEEILAEGYSLLLISDNLCEADDSEMDRINTLATYAQTKGMRMAMLTATEDSMVIASWCDMTGAEYPVWWSDETTLRTMVRSNPGLLLLKDGVVTAKWSHYDIPELGPTSFQLTPEQQPWTVMHKPILPFELLKLALWFNIPLCLLLLFIRKRRQNSAAKA